MMRGIKPTFQGWRIVSFSALAIATMVAVILLIQGMDEQSMRMMLRATARTSCLLFLSAFVASALHRIGSNSFSQWLLKNRRYLGLSFAVSHTYHAIAMFGLWVVTSGSEPKFDPFGTLGYIVLAAMTVTSFQHPTAWIGQRAWKILHTIGMHLFWLLFTLGFALKLSQSVLIYLPILVLLILAMILRLIAPKTQRKLASEKYQS
jgi:methionine sulfoxide reductase heme-binding subunit